MSTTSDPARSRDAGGSCRRAHRAATVGLATLVLATFLVGGPAACSAADDGVRVRDRDGAGQRFEDET